MGILTNLVKNAVKAQTDLVKDAVRAQTDVLSSLVPGINRPKAGKISKEELEERLRDMGVLREDEDDDEEAPSPAAPSSGLTIALPPGLKGMDIFKLLPKSNCKKCGHPTCMSFAMKVAAGQISIDKCPDIPADALAQLGGDTHPEESPIIEQPAAAPPPPPTASPAAFCGNCGQKLEGGVKFCGSCGALVENK
ncbi:hypothetical protein AGMMS49944_10580 [Spirochaetia bacterium]|nr:hypothetical protein AGMMS49944_10580 [Spirochaetia bacterium]